MRMTGVCCALFLLLQVGATSRGGETFKVYSLVSPAAEDVVGMIKGMCGPDARIVYDADSRRLMVYGSSNDHARVEQVLSKANAPLRNIRVDVVTTEIGADSRVAGGVTGSGSVVIGSGGTKANVKLKPHLENTSTKMESSTRQSLLMQSGTESVLFVGSEVPNLAWLVDYGVRSGCVAAGPAWQRVGAYLRVRATALGDGSTVSLRIVPEISGSADGKAAHVRFANMATELTAKDGQTVELGGLNENKDFYSRFLVGMDKTGHSRRLKITATPRIMD